MRPGMSVAVIMHILHCLGPFSAVRVRVGNQAQEPDQREADDHHEKFQHCRVLNNSSESRYMSVEWGIIPLPRCFARVSALRRT